MSNGPITDPRRSPDIASSKVLLILFKLALVVYFSSMSRCSNTFFRRIHK